MKRFKRTLLAFLLVITLGVGLVSIPKGGLVCSAEENLRLVTILSPSFGNSIESLSYYGIDQKNLDTFTPFNEVALARLEGSSFAPDLVGTEGKKHVDTSFNVDASVGLFDASAVDLTKTALELWVNFDLTPNLINRGLTIELTDADETNKITWVLNTEDVKNLTTRETINSFDLKVFGSSENNVPIGWVKLHLPYVTATPLGSEFIKDGKFTFTKFKLYQTAEAKAADQPLSLYDIALVQTATVETENVSTISSYTEIQVKSSAKVKADDAEFYVGESFPKFLSARDVFDCCWVGEENYLDGSHNASLQVMTDTGLGNTSSSRTTYSYGASDFVIKSTNYTITYGFVHSNKFIGILSDSITATDYGKGVWIETELDELNIGETKKIYFNVHKAFKNATIKFESTDTEVMKIVEVNTANNYLVVEALKKGEVGIKISVTDDRLQGTDYEETGIINGEFNFEVVKPKKNVDTTKVLLWIALGLLLAGLIYLAVRAIIDARKIEVK